MEQYGLEINRFLEEVFRDILKTEELHATHSFDNLSLRELHLIEAVCGAVDHQRDNRSSAIAAAQRVTAGTLTTVVNQLEKKGYLIRRRDSQDKRSVRLYPTELGRAATREHRAFHQEMVEAVMGVLSPEEARVFTRGLAAIASFFRAKYLGGGEPGPAHSVTNA